MALQFQQSYRRKREREREREREMEKKEGRRPEAKQVVAAVSGFQERRRTEVGETDQKPLKP
jgi:hypothetical protein